MDTRLPGVAPRGFGRSEQSSRSPGQGEEEGAHKDHGLLVIFSVDGTALTKVDEVKIGQWPQGVAWSRDGKTLLAQSMVDNALAIVGLDGKSLNVTGQIKVTGGSDGIRTAGR
jgi:sugar lactone lactonase YvrE